MSMSPKTTLLKRDCHISENKVQHIAATVQQKQFATMLLIIALAIASLEIVTVEGERCGSNNLGFRCQDNGVCWDEEFVCDGYEQCEDGSDEGTEEVKY